MVPPSERYDDEFDIDPFVAAFCRCGLQTGLMFGGLGVSCVMQFRAFLNALFRSALLGLIAGVDFVRF
jgi:hypothetical protein